MIDEIAHTDLIGLPELLIDFHDHLIVVLTDQPRDLHEAVAADRRDVFQYVDRGRIEPRHGYLIAGERLPRQRIGESLVARRAAGGEVAVALVGRRGKLYQVRPAIGDVRALPAGEKERLVVLNRPAGIAAILLALEEVFVGRKEIPRVERAIAQVAERAAMEVVRAGPGHRVDDRAGAVPLGGAVVAGLNAEFLQRIRKWERLILLEVRIGVACPVQSERHLPRFGPVGRHPQRAGDRFPRFLIDLSEHHPRHQRAQLCGIATVQRQLDDAFRIDDFTEGRRCDVDRGRLAGHRDRFRKGAELDREIHGEVLVRLQQHALTLRRPKPGKLCGDIVGGRPQRCEGIATIGAGHGVSRQSGRHFNGLHGGAGNDATRVVGDHAVDLARLRERGACDEQYKKQCGECSSKRDDRRRNGEQDLSHRALSGSRDSKPGAAPRVRCG